MDKNSAFTPQQCGEIELIVDEALGSTLHNLAERLHLLEKRVHTLEVGNIIRTDPDAALKWDE